MAKHPVPKKKTSKGRTNRRYKAFQNRVQTQLSEQIRLSVCANCGKPVRMHRACEACGHYRGKKLLAGQEADSQPTTIKAD